MIKCTPTTRRLSDPVPEASEMQALHLPAAYIFFYELDAQLWAMLGRRTYILVGELQKDLGHKQPQLETSVTFRVSTRAEVEKQEVQLKRMIL